MSIPERVRRQHEAEQIYKNRVSIRAARQEMNRMMTIQIRASKQYAEREAALQPHERRHDLLLKDYSGTSKTAATLVTSLAAYIQAELAMGRRADPEPLPQQVVIEPGKFEAHGPSGEAIIPPLEPPMKMATRPQDWAEPARGILFGQEAAERAGQAIQRTLDETRRRMQA